MFKRLSIAANLNLILMSLTFIATAVLGVSLLWQKYETARIQLIEQLKWSVTSDLSLQLATYFEDKPVLNGYLSEIISQNFIATAGFSNVADELILQSSDELAVGSSSPAVDRRQYRIGEIVVDDSSPLNRDRWQRVVIPIFAKIESTSLPKRDKNYDQGLMQAGRVNSRQLVGFFHATIDLQELLLSLESFAKVVAANLVAGWLFMAFIIFLATQLLTQPLKRLAKGAKDVSEGRLDRAIRAGGIGEVKEITANFNLLIDELNSHKAQIEVDNKLLTMKVSERTEQLWKRNEELNSAVEQVTQAEANLRYLAYYDSLTSLPNRQLFIEQLSLLLNLAEREHTMLALLYMDLDNFKRINDSLGHSIGDELLKEVASRLIVCLRKSDVLAKFDTNNSEMNLGMSRLGGDEFTVLLNNIVSEDNAAKTADRILEAMKTPFNIKGHEIVVTPSIGIAIAPNDADTVEELLKLADTAMYHAKNSGRNNYAFFSPAMNTSNVERLKIEADLRRALERDEMILYYQPQVNVKTGDIVGVEALVRWQHPEKGLVFPDQFISLAEEMGLIIDLGDWVLQQACKQAKSIADMGLVLPKISVNVSSLQFTSSFITKLQAAMNASGIDPQQLELELTESVIMSHVESAIENLKKIKALGVSVSVDDFGTGYSSLNYLSRFPLDELKIDRSFIVELDAIGAGNHSGLVVAIIAMAKSLNLRLVAEGVDSVKQFDFLSKRDVDVIQGYLFSKPLALEELMLLLEDNPFPQQISRMSRQLEMDTAGRNLFP